MMIEFVNVLAKHTADVTAGCNVTIPMALANVIYTIYMVIKVAVPLLLILFGMIDLGKAVISQKEDDIKKQQSLFIKRLIAAALVFFVFAIVQLVVNLVDGAGGTMSCVNAILNPDKQ